MTIHSLFPTPIYEYQGTIEETFLVQHEIKTILPQIMSLDTFENPPGWNDGVKTNIKSRFNTIQDFQMTNLAAYIETHVRRYIAQTNAWEPVATKLGHSWINIVEKDCGQDWHQHQDATISGTYYYQSTGNDGDISFRTPNPFLELELFPLGNSDDKFYNVQPKIGKIVLFPGWLAHRVETNMQDSARISISFNYLRDNFPAKTC
jgi:uncharacterized protein (TIGR02466 family)